MKKTVAAASLLALCWFPTPRAEAGPQSWGVGCNNSGTLTTLTVSIGPADTARMTVTSNRRGKGTQYGSVTSGIPAYVELNINASGVSVWLNAYSSKDRLIGTFGFSC